MSKNKRQDLYLQRFSGGRISPFDGLSGRGQYWQSAAWNSWNFNIYRNWLYTLALTRFKWVGLPSSCDERYLEQTLFYNGVATIAKPDNLNNFYSLQTTQDGRLNIYENPARWHAIGNNNTRFKVTPLNGVLIYDNILRQPIAPTLDIYARRLAEIDRTIDINLKNQRNPYIITADQSRKNDLINLWKQIDGGEPAIIGTDSLRDIVDQITAINLPVDNQIIDLQTAKHNMFSEIFNFLGINNMPRKNERMIEDEVETTNEPTELMALNALTTRRYAAYELSEKFGLDIRVIWRKDNESENINNITNFDFLKEE